ncbi:MAG TPA: alpha/beta hydrolase [Actinomycetota bacterium]|nr:alpha/beta hydrolase [Actinomycetota bacterium]
MVPVRSPGRGRAHPRVLPHRGRVALPEARSVRTVVAGDMDLPGHGHSPGMAPGRLTLEFCADALAKVVDTYGDEGAVLVGHSLGGVVTLAYLARHPETASRLIRGAVLTSTPMTHFARHVAGRWVGAGLEARALARMMQLVVESDLPDRLLGRDIGARDLSLSYRIVRWGFGKDPSPSQVLFVRDAIGEVRPDVRAETYRVMTRCDLAPLLRDITVPTSVIIGGRDRLVNPEESLMLAEQLPRGRAVVFPESGHVSFLEDHDRFNTEVARFAERRLRRAGARPA